MVEVVMITKAVNVDCAEKAQILRQWQEMKVEHKSYSKDLENELFDEYLRFMTIKVTSVGCGFDPLPSKVVDSMWQAHILCTQLYTAFCSPLTKGKDLIHRNLMYSANQVTSQTGYRLTLAEYRRLFGEDPAEAHPHCWDRYTPCNLALINEQQSTRCEQKKEQSQPWCMDKVIFGSTVDNPSEDFYLVLVHNFCMDDIDFVTTAEIMNKNFDKRVATEAYKERYMILQQTGVIDEIHASSFWFAELGKLLAQARNPL